jgi:transcriptional regulator with XRE-family HTH domain
MNKFAKWMKANDKKQRGVAEKLGISTTTLHDILRKGQMPNMKVAYEIEKYTNGAVTLYDWIDEIAEKEEKQAKKSKKNEK